MAVYEPKFRNSMNGFRPGRSCHEAIKDLTMQIERSKINYVVDADIKGFFNNIEHKSVLELIQYRIADPNMIWLIKKTLTAGVVEDNKWQSTVKGTEHENLASPIIANIYTYLTFSLETNEF